MYVDVARHVTRFSQSECIISDNGTQKFWMTMAPDNFERPKVVHSMREFPKSQPEFFSECQDDDSSN